jgi:outer membrane immunogenic protein
MLCSAITRFCGNAVKISLVGSLIGLALTSVTALAAPPASAPVSWTGCYVDAGLGYGMWKQNHNLETFAPTVPPLTLITTPTSNGGEGWLGRIGVGCDYQVASSFVIGAFADYDPMDINGTSELIVPGTIILPSDPTFSGNEKELGAWSVGGRIGFLVTPWLLTYTDAGYTQARFGQVKFGDLAAPFTPNLYFMPANTYRGWFVGGGTEYALNFDWLPIRGLFWRSEYRYSSYSSADLPVFVSSTGAPTGVGEHVQYNVQTITTELVWRFNFSEPIVFNEPLVTKH